MITTATSDVGEAGASGAAGRRSQSSETVAAARLALLQHLMRDGYRFVTPSVPTHRQVLRRDARGVAHDLRDVFGWSLPFRRELLEADLLACLDAAEALSEQGDLLRSTVRVARLGEDLFLHSAFPANWDDAVFFGPDTYRFANFLAQNLRDHPGVNVLVDLGTGSGVGGVAAARRVQPLRLILRDLNPKALDLARANATAAGLVAECLLGDGLEGIEPGIDLLVANPPFIAGDGGRVYRDGGDLYGARISLDWALAGAEKLAPGGRLLLYTGSAIVSGEDPFEAKLRSNLSPNRYSLTYTEIDPDIFGSQLSAPAYAGVERIAAVGVRIDRI